jgi:glycosyl transferase, family 25
MKIYCVNLDRHAQRLERMKKLLPDLPFERIAAVDGHTFVGPDRRDKSVPTTSANVTRFEAACLISHRTAWQRFLSDGGAFACVLEDDMVFSPDFPDFIRDESWIPAGCNLLKLETFFETVTLSRATRPARNRVLAELHSLHNGSGAYVISRRGAELLIAANTIVARVPDVAMFAPEFSRPYRPILQLIPALCAQAQHYPAEMTLAEFKSSIQPDGMPTKKTAWQRIKKETLRPLGQFNGAFIQPVRRRLTGLHQMVVPHA